MTRTRFRVTGTVQGVGFRPFVYRHATRLGLRGYVLNDSEGVLIEVEGDPERIAELSRVLVEHPPPLARVLDARVIDVGLETVVSPYTNDGFVILDSPSGGAPAVPVSIDSATCDECLAEMFDPSDRRHRYAFTNCTNCGPRYTIVRGVPYDRPLTTMAAFAMCADCQAEYDDPRDRRFHAQPNACPACGPRLSWHVLGRRRAVGGRAADIAIQALRDGKIVAVKGIGGYHLAVDATDASAVAELRRRKARDDKPFAVMVADTDAAGALCVLDDDALSALASPRRPIVLALRRVDAHIAAAVAPNLADLGVMLAYSPLHHLLLAGIGRPLVMTSGNASDEPIAHLDDDAVRRLGPMADGILANDRDIHIRCDDSVVRSSSEVRSATGVRRASGRPRVLRRSRGYAPEPLPLPFDARCAVLAVGAELKNTVSVADGRWVVPSHHIGDLEHLATYQSFVQAVGHMCELYGVTPAVVAHDMHPEYLSSKFAADLDLPLVAVQHHHAHVAACMVEHGRTEPVIALAFDGLGYGPDETLWGGELLLADFTSFQRLGHLRRMPMPGGARAIREPWRMASVWAGAAVGREEAINILGGAGRDGITSALVESVLAVADQAVTPATTSVGRLFDAVAALVGCRGRVTYEAQAAIELEALARSVDRRTAPTYAGVIVRAPDQGMDVLDPAPLVAALLHDLERGVGADLVAAGFHEALGLAAVDFAADAASRCGIDAVVLTGGVFQNTRLSAIVEDGLGERGIRVLSHVDIPANDGGISVGQAAIAAFA